MRILLAEDEKSLARAVSAILQKNNYTVDVVFDGKSALEFITGENYDAIILDIMMPGVDGYTILKIIRSRGVKTPVIFLTAKSDVEDKVKGLDLGANDYLTKPFDSRELLARIRSIIRTAGVQYTSELKMGNITLDSNSFELSGPKGVIRLAGKEFQMLEMMLHYSGRLISVEMFMDRIWGYDTETEMNVVWVYISYLRKKLVDIGANVIIKSVRNSGYYMEVADD